MLEEHFYWVLVLDRWIYTDVDDIIEIFPASLFPSFLPKFLKKGFIKFMFMNVLVGQAHGQGMGRHSKEQVLEMGRYKGGRKECFFINV